MNWFENDKYDEILSEISIAILKDWQKNFKDVAVAASEIKEIIKNYMVVASRLGVPYESVNPEENKKFAADPYIKIIYMAIKNLMSEDALASSDKDITLRDKIWITLSEIKKICSNSSEYRKFWNPASYLETASASREITQSTTSPENFLSKNMMVIGIGAAAIAAFFILGKKK
jgi:hypothetical protein